ncbi:glycine-rich cell wall structural protein precursor [Aquitalea magnusonii]|uniref:Glycine-rich cell wall structural protein n=1 Tax=Aquitalea magnusonii TaxID=332411 RepID=A0A3G9GDB3_9NEIS|nr:glycine zipper domain-containing protein [Aquitalea magnusonii]BBF85860.1 glycine-rich cell wall structural protein precursor [Aquitalea magnusonii]
MKTRILLPALLALSFTGLAHADASAILGGALGGAVGAAVGQSVGGRNGAIIGGAVGGSVGTALAYQRDEERRYRPLPPSAPVVYQPVAYVEPVRYMPPPRPYWHAGWREREQYRHWRERDWREHGWRGEDYRWRD